VRFSVLRIVARCATFGLAATEWDPRAGVVGQEELDPLMFSGFGRAVDFDRWLPEAAIVHTVEVVQRLAGKQEIKDPSHIEEVRKSLCFSGAAYLEWKSVSAEFIKWEEVKLQFSQIASGTTKLRELISNLDEEAATLFWHDENSLRDLHFLKKGRLAIRYATYQ
jgi:hypothetical protein